MIAQTDQVIGTAAWHIVPLAAAADVYSAYCIYGAGDSELLCLECAEAMLGDLVRHTTDPFDICIGGGDDWIEAENCRTCEGPPQFPGSCGRLLKYTLIDLSGELDHFEELSDRELKEMSNEKAHELLCVLEGYNPTYELEVDDDERRVLVLAERVVAALGAGVIKEIDGVFDAQLKHGVPCG